MIDYAARARDMAHIQAGMLLRTSAHAGAEPAARQAVALIRDCVQHLALPALAVELTLELSPAARRWAIWAAWDDVLSLMLASAAGVSSTASARLLLERSHTARMLGNRDDASADAGAALELAERVDDAALVAQAHNAIGLNAYLRDELDVAAVHWQLAQAHAGSGLEELERGHINMNCGTLAMHQGRLDDAGRHFEAACTVYQAAGDDVGYGKARANQAEVLRRSGDAKAALAILAQAEATFARADARYELGLLHNDIGCALLSLERWDDALEALNKAVHEFDRIGSLQGKAWVLPNVAELHVTRGQWAAAERALAEARALAEVCQRPLIVAAVDVDYGRMLAARGLCVEAQHVWHAALALQEAKGAHLAAEHTRALIAELRVSGERA